LPKTAESETVPAASSSAEVLERFWDERAQTFARADAEGWAAVCHRGAHPFFNRFIDWAQRAAFDRLIAQARFEGDDPALDVGCGTGRWARELARCGLRASGIDVSPAMIERARELSPDIPLDVGSATELPVPSGSQQLLSCVTVLHHLEYPQQSLAVAEISRVLRSGGFCLSIVQLDTIPAGTWCYPRSRAGWEDLFAQHGLRPVLHTGEEFLTPAILLHWAAAGVVALLRGSSRGSNRAVGAGPGLLPRAYRDLHRLTVAVSYPLEWLASRLWSRAPASGLATLYLKA
jgi:SAM-dependent methyltransferase